MSSSHQYRQPPPLDCRQRMETHGSLSTRHQQITNTLVNMDMARDLGSQSFVVRRVWMSSRTKRNTHTHTHKIRKVAVTLKRVRHTLNYAAPIKNHLVELIMHVGAEIQWRSNHGAEVFIYTLLQSRSHNCIKTIETITYKMWHIHWKTMRCEAAKHRQLGLSSKPFN